LNLKDFENEESSFVIIGMLITHKICSFKYKLSKRVKDSRLTSLQLYSSLETATSPKSKKQFKSKVKMSKLSCIIIYYNLI